MHLKNKLFCKLLLGMLPFLLTGCSAGFLGLAPAGDRKEYTQARKLYEQGNYQQAITELQDYIYKTKNVKRREARAYRLLGLSYEQTGHLGKALETYLEALEFHPDHVPLLVEAARLYQQTNLTDRSIALYERALKEEPSNAEALAGQAANYAAMGFYSKARQFYDQFFEMVPTAAPKYRARYANTFLAQRNYPQAFINITMALTQEPQNPDFWLLSAQARRGLHQPLQALQDLKAAVLLAPDRPDLLAYQALWLYEAGQDDAARQATERLLALHPQSQLALWVQSALARRKNQEKESKQLLQRIEQIDATSFIGRVAAQLLKN